MIINQSREFTPLSFQASKPLHVKIWPPAKFAYSWKAGSLEPGFFMGRKILFD
jgi:hypothetical protein